jgi:ParB family transcriptional regulator, chromosome partitioning protein
MTRKALGRGLGALLSAEDTELLSDGSVDVPIDLIDPGSLQPRNVFDDKKLDELARSINANGVVQPLLLRRKGSRYELIAGERRWRAAQKAGLTRVPAVLRNVPDEKVLEIALIENIQREDLNPIEEAGAYKRLIDTLGLTQETVADRIGRDRSYITNYLRLLRLSPDLQDLLQNGALSAGHGRALLGLDDADAQRRIAARIVKEDLSVRATERIVRVAREKSAKPTTASARTREVDPNVRAAETKLRRVFGTQVRIVPPSSRTVGKIELEFYNQSDLLRLFDLMTQNTSG